MIWFVASDSQGGGRVRSFWPAHALKEAGLQAFGSEQWPSPGSVETLIVHRPLDPSLDKIRAHQAHGTRVLVDEDDDLDAIPGNRWWKKIPPELLEQHDAAIRLADGLIVSTQPLAEKYGQLAKQTWICRNHLPAWVGRVSYTWRKPRVRVGWQGVVRTHLHDLKWLAPEANRAFAGATLNVVGETAALRQLRADRIPQEACAYQNTPEGLYKAMAMSDIGIVPLAPIALNMSKSWLKAVEYMTLGKPVVACDFPEQRLAVDHAVNGFVARTPEEFADYTQTLIHDSKVRQILAQGAKATGKKLSLESNLDQWIRVCHHRHDSEQETSAPRSEGKRRSTNSPGDTPDRTRRERAGEDSQRARATSSDEVVELSR